MRAAVSSVSLNKKMLCRLLVSKACIILDVWVIVTRDHVVAVAEHRPSRSIASFLQGFSEILQYNDQVVAVVLALVRHEPITLKTDQSNKIWIFFQSVQPLKWYKVSLDKLNCYVGVATREPNLLHELHFTSTPVFLKFGKIKCCCHEWTLVE